MRNRVTTGVGFPFARVSLALIVCCLCSAEATAQKKVTLEQVFEVWKRRQDSARTVSFSWSGQATYMPGSMMSPGSVGPAGAEWPRPGAAPKRMPPKDISNPYQMSLILDGGMMRFTSNRPRWFVNYERFIPRTTIAVFDGKTDKWYQSEASDGSQGVGLHKTGRIRKEQYEDVTDYILWPVLFTYRGADPKMSRFGAEAWAMAPQISLIKDRKCAILTKTHGNVTETCWVDVERECSILRYDYAADGQLRVRLDVTHKDDPKYGFMPSHWTVTRLFPKTAKTAETMTAAVSEYQIGNPVSAETFRFDFPPGTLVTDEANGTRYIAQEGEHQRPITSEEFSQGVSYEQLLETPPLQPWWGRVWLPTLILLLLVAAILLFWRRAFGSKAPRGVAGDLPN